MKSLIIIAGLFLIAYFFLTINIQTKNDAVNAILNLPVKVKLQDLLEKGNGNSPFLITVSLG